MIVITGAGRSGTSMIAGFIGELGVSLGSSSGFFETDLRNEKGYFEQKDINDLNSRLITNFPRTGNRLTGLISQGIYSSMPNQSMVLKRSDKYSPMIKKLFQKYNGCVVKDPRFCLTLPAWRRYCAIEKVVVCIRHPEEVVQSLAKAYSYPILLGYRFWNYHVNHLLKNITDMKELLFVDYNNFSSKLYQKECDNLARFFGVALDDEKIENIYQTSYQRSLKHFENGKHHSSLPAKTQNLWEILLSQYKHQAIPSK